MPKKKAAATPDAVIAQLAAARQAVRVATDLLDDAVELYLLPSEDPNGRARADALEEALDALGDASRHVEGAQRTSETVETDEAPEWMPEDEEAEGED